MFAGAICIRGGEAVRDANLTEHWDTIVVIVPS